MQQFLDELNTNPAYRHLLINHLPILGLAAAALVLFFALFFRSRAVLAPALIAILLLAASAIPVRQTGEQAFKQIEKTADDAGVDWLYLHADRANAGMPAYYVLAGLALVALLAPFKWPRSATPLALAVLLASFACIAIGGWIAQAGGPVIHVELRPPLPAEDTTVSLPTDPDP
jgi:hypothetical protein